MNSRHNLANLFEIAFASGNCNAIRILNRRVLVDHDPFDPQNSFSKLPIEDARADGFKVFFDLFESDFYSLVQAIDSVPFRYKDLTEDEFVTLLRRVPGRYWAQNKPLVHFAYVKAIDRGLSDAVRFIVNRILVPVQQFFHQLRPDFYGTQVVKFIKARNIETLSVLLEIGLDINSDAINHEFSLRLIPLLYSAIFQSSPEVIDFFLENGACIDRTDREGSNTFIVASIHHGDKAIYQKLIEAGTPPTLSQETARLLLERGLLILSTSHLSIFHTITAGEYISDDVQVVESVSWLVMLMTFLNEFMNRFMNI